MDVDDLQGLANDLDELDESYIEEVMQAEQAKHLSGKKGLKAAAKAKQAARNMVARMKRERAAAQSRRPTIHDEYKIYKRYAEDLERRLDSLDGWNDGSADGRL